MFMQKIVKFVVLDIFRNKILIAYTLLLAIASWSAFSFEDNSTKGVLTVLSILLMVVPLVSIIFATIYFYNSNEFIELLLSQPVERSRIWLSLFIGIAVSLVAAFVVGAGIAILVNTSIDLALTLILAGCLLSVIFAAMAALSCMLARDKAKGIGIAIMVWLFVTFLFDAIVLYCMFQFSDYPIEKPMIALTSLNPVDLSRILVLLKLDVSAMMGYTGAIFKQFFGTGIGLIISLVLLILWIIVPFGVSLRKFKRKDL